MNELTVTSGEHRVVLRAGQGARVGRSASNDLVVDDPRVSREHLRVSWASDGWIIENVGRAGSSTLGRPLRQLFVDRPLDVRLVGSDGPVVSFRPDTGAQSGTGPGNTGGRAPSTAPVPRAEPPARAPGPTGPPGATPAAAVPGGGLHAHLSGVQVLGAIRILVPILTWLRDPQMRKWYRVLVVVYALVPLAFLLLNTGNFTTLGWIYSLYIAPLWVLVFWYLIRPGRIGPLEVLIAAIFIGAEYILVPAFTLPWENALAPSPTSHSLIQWIYGVGIAEELTKDLPVLVVAYVLLRFRHRKLDSRKWMFLATISGLMFGVSEAAGYVSQALGSISKGEAVTFAVQSFAERVFVDGLQHAVWAGIAGFFIGLGINYHRQRIPLWLFGILVPSALHGLNDWSLSGVFGSTNSGVGTNPLPWLAIQLVSLVLFLGYTVSAASIERDVRHSAVFRGESIYMDPSLQVDTATDKHRS